MSISTLDRLGLADRLQAAKAASATLRTATSDQKNRALAALADALRARVDDILRANSFDIAEATEKHLAPGLVDRLTLTAPRVNALADAVEEVGRLTDPVGESVRGASLPNGIRIAQVRVPFGVVGAIYEARPNVTVDIATLALKSGNAVVLRGGSDAIHTNQLLVEIIRAAIASTGLSPELVHSIDDLGRSGATELMRARGMVDVLIPRGSAELIQTVVRESTVPVIETGAGVVHIFLDSSAREDWAVDIVQNAKVQRPSVCNAVETLLVHVDAAARLLPSVLGALGQAGVTIHGDDRVRALYPDAIPVTEAEWATEHMSLDISVGVVDSLDAALEHIRTYSTQHTESIITNDLANAERFLAEVDSAVVMVNASTRFTDGGEFGFGAEVGISTQKLHARGPMGLPELTTTKWIVRGDGQVRA